MCFFANWTAGRKEHSPQLEPGNYVEGVVLDPEPPEEADDAEVPGGAMKEGNSGDEDAGPAAQLGPEVAQDPLRLLQTRLVVHREHDEEGVRGVGAHLVLHLGILRFPSHDWIHNW